MEKYLSTGQASRDIGVKNVLNLMERMNVVSFEEKKDYILIKKKPANFNWWYSSAGLSVNI